MRLLNTTHSIKEKEMRLIGTKYSIIAFGMWYKRFSILCRFKKPIDTGHYRLFFLIGMPWLSIAFIKYN